MFGIGLVIGRNERVCKEQCNMDNNNNVLSSNGMGSDRINTLDSSRMFPIRQNDRQDLEQGCYEKGKITIGCTRSAFELMLIELNNLISNVEKDALRKGIELCDEKLGE